MEEENNPEKARENSDPEEKLAECERQKHEYLSGWQRARADFLNYKKEEMERIRGFIAYSTEELFLKLLPILDSFERAEKAVPANSTDECVKGVLNIKSLLRDFLRQEGIVEIQTSGCKFDPNFHEAVDEEERAGAESGTIVEEVQKGYTINGRVLRPAKIKVAK
ncbi:MAG: nucleotide exchange factor GrpE [Candidatus Wildermuthbacteria bacterium RIFCSPHIGHO2_01_FULL_47_27]|uniref:Protein GrpE n=2 Tax=Candidatus Wildermuthiibacteriota TaxID=1817923 RepID=A0A1G2RSA4_9BACT|nr:MAG: Protein GrpE [Parcubacteria group bacterium GW2011_GWA2_47_9]OHA63267.1 MAG: nucleotide exchange factor GrpE [Candidatus Wildermuthbacteria bacterium RIFCSPHIGHO2_01_FULL_47_27]OHA67638.1 MAG: nucleotide exchange factor GrpE [Candidatus Wildermuthbacteria bacterium RIFCSPHIGHO2_02_FULL_47_17]OHA75730.1 MAG: nucleotide exchange factor GrpE [Candidatus Wildermuthbacteria bacterium RIFCSPLOWO2_01_FULL_48_35]OHA76081.1 MAG: nucleotide exchange factor GrpE [Candidatus Wildermuthbacteria bact